MENRKLPIVRSEKKEVIPVTISKKKIFSIRKKLLIFFASIVFIAVAAQGIIGAIMSRKAILEKVEVHLTDKAKDTAALIDAMVYAFLNFVSSASRASELRDIDAPYSDKIAYLKKRSRL